MGFGLRVMLVESRGFLGGNLTIGLPILGFLGRKGNQIIEGLTIIGHIVVGLKKDCII